MTPRLNLPTIETKLNQNEESGKNDTQSGLSFFSSARKARKTRRREVSQTYWAQEQAESETGLSLATRTDLLKKHGSFSLAFSTAVQPRLMHYGDEKGYIAFRKRWGMTFALGDAVASQSDWPQLIDAFTKQHRRVSFCQVSQPMAELLFERGYYINSMGVDTTLKLGEYDFAGKQKEWLRYASNWINRRNYRIEELSFDEIEPSQVESVSEAWRKTRTVKRKEVRFLNRPIVLKDEANVRKFFLFSPQDELLAFVFLDPIYDSGEIVGYVTVFKRRHPDAPIYAEQAIMKHVIETLKSEGVGELKLGLSPFAGINEKSEYADKFQKSRMTQWFFHQAYSARWVNRYFYNVVGHAEYKRRFRGSEEKVYFACSSRFGLPGMLALIGLCGIA